MEMMIFNHELKSAEYVLTYFRKLFNITHPDLRFDDAVLSLSEIMVRKNGRTCFIDFVLPKSKKDCFGVGSCFAFMPDSSKQMVVNFDAQKFIDTVSDAKSSQELIPKPLSF